MKKKAQIMEILLRVKPLFKGNFEQDNLDIYTEMLIEFESSQVFEAIKRLSRKNTFFPAYAEIVKEIEQPVDIDALARVEIPKVWQAVRKYGRSRYKEAQEFMGEMLWQAVGAAHGPEQGHGPGRLWRGHGPENAAGNPSCGRCPAKGGPSCQNSEDPHPRSPEHAGGGQGDHP